LVEPTSATVIDVSTVAAAVEVPIPNGADVQLRADNVAVIDSDAGDMWLAPIDRLGSVQTQEDAPIAVGPRGSGALAENGRLLTVNEEGETSRYRFSSDGELSQRATGHIGTGGAGPWDDVTAVGEQLVGLRDGQVHV